MIIVTGASGQLGRTIVQHLLSRVPAAQVGVSVRDPLKAADLEGLGVRVRRGDFAEPASLPHAFEGASQVLLVSSNAAAYGGEPLAQHRTAVAAAKAAGATRIVYTSHMAASALSAFPPMRDHAATEEMLRQSGLAWTALRNGFYVASGLMLMGDALQTGVLAAPADGKVSWTTHADLAEAAAIILANDGQYDGPTPPLTGSQALNLADLAGIASELLGRAVVRQFITDEDLRAKMAARGTPAGVAGIMLGLYAASRAGEFAAVDPTLGELLGRAPTTMRDVLATRLAGEPPAANTPSSSSPDKRVALITGANKGIGYEVARQLGVDHGMTVLVGARDAARGREAADKLTVLGVDARPVQLDVTDPANVAAVAAQIGREFGGRLDVLVNNAGVSLEYAPPSQTDLEKYQATHLTNAFGPLVVTKAMLPLLRRAAAGRVVNVSSGLGSLTQNNDPSWEYAGVKLVAYNSSKAALNMQTVLFAAELAAENSPVKVNSADPGYTATDLNNHTGPRTVEEGARAAVRLATLPADGPTGGFFDDDGPVSW